ncbi:MAG: threonine aldolase family protein [Acidimicrobiales bacterium]
MLHPGSIYAAPTTLVSLENTHNFAGGAVWNIDGYRAVAARAHEAGAWVHVDGLRLFNATAASGVPLRDWAAPVDSIWVDFTKGLGAPIGAVLAGSAEFIQRARRYKHVFGAAMRQAGIAAAGCLHALDNHVERLADDHANAARLAAGLAAAGCQVVPVETNIVFFDPPTGLTIDEFHEGERQLASGFSQADQSDYDWWYSADAEFSLNDADYVAAINGLLIAARHERLRINPLQASHGSPRLLGPSFVLPLAPGRVLSVADTEGGLIIETSSNLQYISNTETAGLVSRESISLRAYPRSKRPRRMITATVDGGLLLTTLLGEHVIPPNRRRVWPPPSYW